MDGKHDDSIYRANIASRGKNLTTIRHLILTTALISFPGRLEIVSVVMAWRSGKRSSSMNEVNARRARLQLGWVTVFGRVYHLGL